ncbi:uncharacterized protein BKA78DRAFT_312143 [Phyllosticta capitalensis]|uniref:uncharacterized protein n=1 Tax=Phyllosticta capitalensis TaxID=121624 RepID=UPI003131D40D
MRFAFVVHLARSATVRVPQTVSYPCCIVNTENRRDPARPGVGRGSRRRVPLEKVDLATNGGTGGFEAEAGRLFILTARSRSNVLPNFRSQSLWSLRFLRGMSVAFGRFRVFGSFSVGRAVGCDKSTGSFAPIPDSGEVAGRRMEVSSAIRS